MAKFPKLALIPPIAFAGVAALFLGGMFWGSDDDMPSTMIGRDAPVLPAQSVPGTELATVETLTTGDVTIVNFWASWCPPCRAEHPVLHELAEQGYRIVGVNFRDTETASAEYLEELGNPFIATGFDRSGRVAIDWGVTAPPETFIIDGDGKVLFRFIGPLVGSDYEQRFLPALENALAD